MTLREVLRKGICALSEKGFEDAVSDARALFFEAFHLSSAAFLSEQFEQAGEEETKRFLSFIEKRLTHVPVSQITGKVGFMNYDFFVNEHVLSPRQDTELLTEEALKRIKAGDKILDMCTGSGCIAISLYCMSKEAGKQVEVAASDLSEDALKVAAVNNEEIAGGGVKLYHGNLFASLPDTDKFDMIVSNPPYIRTAVIEELMPEVKDHEPRMALDGTEDGLLFYRRLAVEGKPFLKEGGFLIVEIGYDQGNEVSEIFADAGFKDIRVYKDLAMLDRVVCAENCTKRG